MTAALAGLFAAALATSALAQPPAGPPAGAPRPAPPPVNKDPTKVRPGPYMVEPEHTRLMFGISHKGFTTFYGEFRQLTGTLMLDPKDPSKSTFDIKIPVTTISTQIEKLNDELRHKPWIDADTYPTMEFKSTSVKPTSATEADVTGDFTFHGQTHPLTLHVKFNASGDDPQDKYYVAGFTVSGGFKRSDWGFGFAVPMIGDEIQLIIQAAFKIPAGS